MDPLTAAQKQLAELEAMEREEAQTSGVPQAPKAPIDPIEAAKQELAALERFEKMEATPEWESALRGAAQGASFGYADEATAALLAGKKWLEGDEDFVSEYKKQRDESREAYKLAQEANPKSYMAGEIGGGLSTAFVPGLGGAKAAGLLKTVGRGMIEGGIYAGGASEADLTEGEVGQFAQDVAGGSALGGGTSAVMTPLTRGATKLASKTTKALKGMRPARQTARKAGSLAFDLPEEYTEEILKRPQAVGTTRSLEQLEDDVARNANTLRQKLAKADSVAWDTLDRKKVLPADVLDFRIRKAVKKYDLVGKTAVEKRANAKINEIYDLVNQVAGESPSRRHISEYDMKRIIKKADDEINWSKEEFAKSNDVLMSIRTEFNNILKNRNKEYASAMKPVQEMAETLDGITSDMRLTKGTEGRLFPTDTTRSKLKNLFSGTGEENKRFTAERLEKMGQYAGDEGFASDVKMRRILNSTQTGVAQGSRSTLMGLAGGGALTATMGLDPSVAVLMAAGGYAKDKYGRVIGRQVMKKAAPAVTGFDNYFQKFANKIPELPDKYRGVLESAARRGGTALAVSNYLLGQTDPEYQRLMRETD